MKKSLSISIIAYSALLATYAQGLNSPIIPPTPGGSGGANIGTNLRNIVVAFKDIANGVYSSLFVVALIMFFVGIIRLFASKDAAGKQESYKFLGFGILALFVMVGVWGLVGFLSSTFNIGIGGDIVTPVAPNGNTR